MMDTAVIASIIHAVIVRSLIVIIASGEDTDGQNRIRGIKMDELKPCPFCGSKPIINVVRPYEFFISCKRIYCVEQKHLYATRASAIKAWNRRAEPYKGE